MPRPRKNPDELLKRELRITPPNEERIEDWLLDDKVIKFVAFEEGGGDTGKKLHYHCYIETTMTSQALPKWIYRVANCIETGERGNAVFFTRAPHEHTFGYISKEHKCVISHGILQRTLDEWFTQSAEYVKQRATVRKREQRTRSDELQNIYDLVALELEQKVIQSEIMPTIYSVLEKCHSSGIRFPARTQMEQMVIKLLYRYNAQIAGLYYARSFPHELTSYS